MGASPSPKALATVTAATRTLPGGSPTLRVRADAVSGHATPPAVGPARGSEPPPRPRAGPPLPFRASLVARQPTPCGRCLPSGPRSSRPSRTAPSPPVPCMALVLPLKRPGSRPTPRELVTPRGPCGQRVAGSLWFRGVRPLRWTLCSCPVCPAHHLALRPRRRETCCSVWAAAWGLDAGPPGRR